MIRYSFLIGDVNWKKYGGKFISNRLNNGDWDYYLVIEVINLHDEYCVTVSAVSPQAAGKDNLDRALGFCGFSDEDLKAFGNNHRYQVEALSYYGIAATLWQESGNNIHKLLKAARLESRKIETLFGFYMDKRQNMIGNTGWDFIEGVSS